MATNKQFLRLYTLGGVQREVISLPGQVVTLNGEGDYVIIVYQETTSMLNYTCTCICSIMYYIISVDSVILNCMDT